MMHGCDTGSQGTYGPTNKPELAIKLYEIFPGFALLEEMKAETVKDFVMWLKKTFPTWDIKPKKTRHENVMLIKALAKA